MFQDSDIDTRRPVPLAAPATPPPPAAPRHYGSWAAFADREVDAVRAYAADHALDAALADEVAALLRRVRC